MFTLVACPRLAWAQGQGIEPGETLQQPKERTTQVTASVADNIDPSTPLLIEPEDDEKLNDGEVTFVWSESTDNWAMSHYQLWLDGELYFDNIPLSDDDNSDYTLVYDSTDQEYSLTVNDELDDGSYDWYIVAVDYHDNSATSVEWEFLIDTKAPDFTIVEVGGLEVEITTGDEDSVPDEAISLEKNEPKLEGTGEKDSTVNLTINLPGGEITELEFEIDEDGEWKITLPVLPRDEVIYLDFLITDPTGNVSVLVDLPIIIVTKTVVIPLPDLPPIQLPPIIPPIIPPDVIPDLPPEIEVPVTPPGEYVPPPIREAPERIAFYVRNYSATAVEYVVNNWARLWLISALLLLLALPLAKVTALAIWLHNYLSAELWRQILWLIGWGPGQPPQGIVVERATQGAVPFGLVLVSGKNSSDRIVRKTLITNKFGIFPATYLEDGEYRLGFQHPHYFFPSLDKPAPHLSWDSYYVGRSITIKNGSTPPLLALPVEALDNPDTDLGYRLRTALLSLPSLNIVLLAGATTLMLIFPSIVNVFSTLLYAGLLIRRRVIENRWNTEILTVNPEKEAQNNVIVGVLDDTAEHPPISIGQTDLAGSSRLQLEAGSYTMKVIDFKQAITEGDNKTRTTLTVEEGPRKNFHTVVMD